MSILKDKHLILGVTGSIAAYKAVDLASKLTQVGAQVDCILTPIAEKFVSSLTYQSVTGRKAYTDADMWGGEAHVLHVGLGNSADLLVIAPCTANTIAKLANGMADNLLTISALAVRCPILIAPAMDSGMYLSSAMQDNLKVLNNRGIHIVGPIEGRMASGLEGKGRMSEPITLLGYIRLLLGKSGKLSGKTIVVTAGGTQEAIDPVRIITNKSTGKQGYALAQAAMDAGATVTLITTPTSLPPPIGARIIEVRTAQEMMESVLAESAGVDGLLMAAAVADFRPKEIAIDKIKKKNGITRIELEPTSDILETVTDPKRLKKRPHIVIGFAAENSDLIKNASSKLNSKRLDMIAANDISSKDAGFGTDTNRVTLLYADGRQEDLPLMGKDKLADLLINRLVMFLEDN